MRTLASLTVCAAVLGSACAFVPSVPPQRAPGATRLAAGAGADDDWRSIVGSEANLRQYLGGEGFRYCLNKTPEELEKEGDYGLLEKMFGATSNNDARLAAKSYGRALTIDKYDPAKAEENKEWIAKYGYKRWGVSYVDKSQLDEEAGAKPAAAPAAKSAPAKPAAAKPAFSFPKIGGGNGASAAPKASGGSGVKAAGGVKAAKPAASAAPAKPAAAPAKPAAPKPATGPLSAKAPAKSNVNLNLLKKPGSQ